MRLATCALSAVLLSGCSWFGGSQTYYDPGGQAYYYGHAPAKNAYGQGAGSSVYSVGAQQGQFPQQPDFSGGYGSGYGSHAAQAGQHSAGYASTPKLKKPKLRGSLSLNAEKSVSGAYVDYPKFPGIDPEVGYNPNNFAEGNTVGSVTTGNITQTTYTAIVERVDKPTISFDDVHSTPVGVSAGLEYIFSPKTTLFANAGYSHSEGKSASGVGVVGELRRIVTSQDYVEDAGNPGTYLAAGGPVVGTSFVPNVPIAEFTYDFSDMQRYDLEVGARHYFKPIVTDQDHRTVTPFVGVAAGARHYNDQSFSISQRQVFFQRAFDSSGETLDFYDVPGAPTFVDLYDAQWVPTGAVTAGMEWQVTPSAAFAMETGVRYEGARDYSNGASGDDNISIPLTFRGSLNF